VNHLTIVKVLLVYNKFHLLKFGEESGVSLEGDGSTQHNPGEPKGIRFLLLIFSMSIFQIICV